MRQLTIYLDRETESRIRAAARSAKMSLSKWVASLVRERTAKSWPKAVADLSGAWPDFPSPEELRKSQASDIQREAL
jgi:hypothetical protein